MTILIIILVLVLIVAIYCFVKYKHHEGMVKENSVKLNKLKKLNEDYSFNVNVKKKIEVIHYVMSKTELSRANFNELIKNLMKDNANNIKLNLEYVMENEKKYNDYLNKYNSINDVTPGEIISITNMKLKSFNFFEKRFFKSEKMNPIVATKVVIVVRFEESNGDNKYQKQEIFSYNQLCDFYSNLDDKLTLKK